MLRNVRKIGLKSHKRKSFSKKSILREPFVVIFQAHHSKCVMSLWGQHLELLLLRMLGQRTTFTPSFMYKPCVGRLMRMPLKL